MALVVGPGVALVELCDLSQGSPAGVAAPKRNVSTLQAASSIANVIPSSRRQISHGKRQIGIGHCFQKYQ